MLLGCILGDDWRGTDKETEYPELMAATSCLSLSAAMLSSSEAEMRWRTAVIGGYVSSRC